MKDIRKHYNECQIGEIITRDVVDFTTGVVLCKKGHILTEESLRWLEKFQVSEVYIQKDEWSKVWNINQVHTTAYRTNLMKLRNLLEESRVKGIVPYKDLEQISENFFEMLSDNSTIMGCVNMFKEVGNYTYAHSLNVAMLAVLIGKWIDLEEEQLHELFCAGLLHDIGKFGIPEKILHKRGKMTSYELKVVRAHAQIGYQQIKSMIGISDAIKEGVWTHHERADGRGYPRGLKGDQIHLYGKILGVADVYDAMISERVYKKKETPFHVMEHLMTDELDKLDPHILMTFLSHIADYYVGVNVKLSTQEDAEVIFIPNQCIYRPVVKVGEAYVDLGQRRDIKIIDIL
ncbi:MAG: HD-GYP domain-containing protein [Cellulosilyticaceae bacterium]